MPEVDFQLDPLPDYHERLATLRKAGPVVPARLGGEDIWFIVDFAEADRAFRDYDNFSASLYNLRIMEQFLGHSMMGMEGLEHKQNRGIVQPAFTFGSVRSYVEGIIEPTAHELLDRLEGRDEVDIRAEFCKFFPFTVITKMLGVPVEDEVKLVTWASEMISYMYDEDASRRAVAAFHEFIIPLMEERRRNPTDDLISHIVHAEVDGARMTDDEVLAFLKLLYPAGGHSTSLGVASAVYWMLKEPEAKAMVMQGEPERWAVVQEALRMEPPFGTFPRTMLNDLELGGVTLKKDEVVWISITGANHDPKQFPDPEGFDPHRKNLAGIMTFGRNTHMCLGRNLAMREIDVALRVLCERFPNMALAPDREVVVSGTTFRTCEELWVRLNG